MERTKRAIPYARFSHPSQIETDSLRRQTDQSRGVAAFYGLELDETVRFVDLGISAFKGKNRLKGALADILAATRAGAMPPYTKLIVENIDRISRQDPYAAMGAVRELCDLNIIIVTADMQVYSRERLARDPGAGFILQGVLLRAHEESKTKSERVRAARERNREALRSGGGRLPRMLPGWLVNVQGRAVEIDSRVETLRLIFQLAAEAMGSSTIARRLNKESRDVFDRAGQGIKDTRSAMGWDANRVVEIITGIAVRGYYQPHTLDAETGERLPTGEPIRCYPVIVDDAMWHAANAHVRRRAERLAPDKTPDKARIANLLSGMVICGLCGQRVSRFHQRTRHGSQPFLVCDVARRALLKEGKRWCMGVGRHPYDAVEEALKATVAPLLTSSAVIGANLEHAGAVEAAQRELATAQDTADRVERQARRVMALDEDDPLLIEVMRDRKATRARLKAAQEALDKQRSTEAANAAAVRAMGMLIVGVNHGDDEARGRFRDILREHVNGTLHEDRLEVRFGVAVVTVQKTTGEFDVALRVKIDDGSLLSAPPATFC